ncbi:hypothetical protein ANN_02423 [Periplaneta americana]|uniref:Uncharacterized protein n=1 Tax=Periplaneta americana TaxID=6978 RepID=A0ABQ8TWB3_PERAM|nr:hypothetical protein ANN_02423 [Periplaneta americana]
MTHFELNTQYKCARDIHYVTCPSGVILFTNTTLLKLVHQLKHHDILNRNTFCEEILSRWDEVEDFTEPSVYSQSRLKVAVNINSIELVSIVRSRNMFAFSSDERAFNIESYFRTDVRLAGVLILNKNCIQIHYTDKKIMYAGTVKVGVNNHVIDSYAGIIKVNQWDFVVRNNSNIYIILINLRENRYIIRYIESKFRYQYIDISKRKYRYFVKTDISKRKYRYFVKTDISFPSLFTIHKEI